MNIFLSELSKEIELGRHIAMIIDNAGWHNSKGLNVPANITLVPLPPYAPELNGMEQVWKWMKEHYLYNQCYSSYEDIVARVSEAWNYIANDFTLVKSIIHRNWIYL